HRILKPGGRFITTDWIKIEQEIGPPLHHRMAEEEAISALEKAGFSDVESLPGYEYHYILRSYKKVSNPQNSET
ncbi:MAG: hypothetical protein ACFFBD_14735, partial [Candidatus Hodarchaeota archaeon]